MKCASVFAAFVVAAAALTTAFAGIDLWTSGLFYRAGAGFIYGNAWPLRAIYGGVPLIVDAIVIGVVLLLVLSRAFGRRVWGIDRRIAVYLLVSLAIGPGLLVNSVLKDHWGRARPSQVTEFGGTQHFTPAILPADQCKHNCSFPAGHPAIGFYLVSFAFLIGDPRRRRVAELAAVAAGSLIGVARIAQGGHFLSDVIFSGLLVVASSWLCHRAFIVHDGLGILAREIRLPRWVGFLALVTAASMVISMIFIDRPLAFLFHDVNGAVHETFAFITQFGLSKGYLVLSGGAAAALGLSAWLARGSAVAARLALGAYRASFIFLAVAVSGILTDFIKIAFGRARPKLLFRDDFYGFHWGATQADYWSLPSGHATTVAALASALFLLWPRLLPAYVTAALLIAASRVILDAHYLSDVMAGAFVGVAVAWALWHGFGRYRIPLSDSP